MRVRRGGLLATFAVFWTVGMTFPADHGPVDGVVMPAVECRAVKGVTYALYLPKGYSPDKRRPVLIGFDPGGRGLNVVNAFREAADAYGWIVAGSNDFRNGTWKETLPGIEAVWNDVVKRYPVDPRRVYTTGFSGGARVAAAMGWVQLERVAGVIACGAGLPEGLVLTPGEFKAAFLGVVGETDFNYLEMEGLDDLFEKMGTPYRRMVFEGSHEWPPPPVLKAAVEWMELQGMRQGRRLQDTALVRGWYERDAAEARRREASGDLLEACRLWLIAAGGYQGFFDGSAAQAEAKRIAGSPGFEKALSKTRKSRERETRESRRCRETLEKTFSPDRRLPDVDRLARELKLDDCLRRAASDRESPGERLSDRRILNTVFSLCVQEAFMDPQAGSERQILRWRLAARIEPAKAWVQVQLACALAAAGRNGEAFSALEEGVRRGFRNRDYLLQEPRLGPLRGEKRFESLMSAMGEGTSPREK